eukprot:1229716-Rhodomonas_salina.2
MASASIKRSRPDGLVAPRCTVDVPIAPSAPDPTLSMLLQHCSMLGMLLRVQHSTGPVPRAKLLLEVRYRGLQNRGIKKLGPEVVIRCAPGSTRACTASTARGRGRRPRERERDW